MPWMDGEQIKKAKAVDLLTYLRENEPHELKESAPGEYRTVSHGSLVISKGMWCWNREGIGGRSALDYLIKVRGMDFLEAVQTILDARGVVYTILPEEKANSPPKSKTRAFYPPKPIHYSNKAVAYLQERGISPEVINRAMCEGTLYESRYYNPESPHHNAPVCVFAGKDESGKPVYAAMRGIGFDFKKDKAGSDKRFNFTLPAKKPDNRILFVFEAPIDLLSHATLQQRGCWGLEGHRLSLGGTSSLALISFLERNPQITRVVLNLDSDVAGLNAAESIKEQLRSDARFKHIRVSYNPPDNGAKDYNELLLRIVSLEREQKQKTKYSAR